MIIIDMLEKPIKASCGITVLFKIKGLLLKNELLFYQLFLFSVYMDNIQNISKWF